MRNPATRTKMATYFAGLSGFGTLFSADPGTTGAATNELTGGSPAFARVATGWGTAANSAVTGASEAFNVPSGATVAYHGLCTSSTLGTADVNESVALPTSQTFSSQGTYTVVPSYVQS